MKALYAGKRNIQVVTQKGPVNVGKPIGAKNAFIAACTNTVAVIPRTHHIADFQEKLQNVAPSAMPVKTALKPYSPFDMSAPGPCQQITINSDSADAIAAHNAARQLFTASQAKKNIPVTQELIKKT